MSLVKGDWQDTAGWKKTDRRGMRDNVARYRLANFMSLYIRGQVAAKAWW